MPRRPAPDTPASSAPTSAWEWEVAGVAVSVRRSRQRRTVALQVRPGEVTLLAPPGVPLAELGRVLEARRAWIERHLAGFAVRAAQARQLGDGVSVPFLGESLTVVQLPAGPVPAFAVRLEGDRLLVPAATPAELEAGVMAWTRRACLPEYERQVRQAAALLGAEHRLGQVAVSAAAGRWGSCTARGDIRLHWKLSRAPLEVLRYVAVHEAAHLLELNHSARYWAHVSRAMPDHAKSRAWLREWGHTL